MRLIIQKLNGVNSRWSGENLNLKGRSIIQVLIPPLNSKQMADLEKLCNDFEEKIWKITMDIEVRCF